MLSTNIIRVLCLGVVFGFATAHAQTLFTFDQGSELATLFTCNSNLSQIPYGGVANSGAVQVAGTSAVATYKGSSFDFSRRGLALSCSIFFEYQNPTQMWYPIQLGFLGTPNQLFDANANAMGVQVSVTPDTALYVDFGRTGYGAGIPALTPGNWYRLTGTFSNAFPSLKITASLDDFGPTGTTFLNNIHSLSLTAAPDGNIIIDSSVWLAFEAFSTAGVSRIDNLAFVPEPGSAALLLMAGGLLTKFARKSKSLSAQSRRSKLQVRNA